MLRAAHERQRFRCPPQKLPMHRKPFPPHVWQVEPLGAWLRDRHEIGSTGQKIGPNPEALTADPFDPVALDRHAHLSADDEAQPRRFGCQGPARLSRDEQDEMSRGDATTKPLRTNELTVRAEPSTGAERERHRHGLRRIRGREGRPVA
jgi:hypothetical protein